MNFPVFSQLAGNWGSETGSLETASSSRESATNCFATAAIGCTAPPAVVRRKISPRAHGATRPPGYDARYSVILVPIFVRRCSPLPYVPSPVFLLFAAFNRSALRCSSDSGDGLSGLRQAVNSETLNISDCGKRPAGLHSLTRCWWATRLSIVCRS
jgi:hypothetical protein